MLGSRLPLAVALLVVAGLLTVAARAGANTAVFYRFHDRPSGMPATGEPARTLADARATLYTDPDSSDLTAWVELGAVPTPDTGAEVHLRLGTIEAGVCRLDWEVAVPTLDPTGLGSRDGTTVRIAASMAPLPYSETRCGSVSLVAPDGTLLDRLDDNEPGGAIDDPGAWSQIQGVTGTHVRPWRWSKVWVRVTHHGNDAEGVRVTGKGFGMRVQGYTVNLDLHDGDQVWAPLRVKLRGDRPRVLKITAMAFGNLAFVGQGLKEVQLRPVTP